MNLYCGCLLYCYLFCLFLFYPILIRLSILCHFNSGELDSQSRIRFPPGDDVLIWQFCLLLLKYHHKFSLNILKRKGSSISQCFICCCPERNVSRWFSSATLHSDDHHRVVGTCCKQINRYKCVFLNLIDNFWRFLEDTHACVFVIFLVWLRDSRLVLEKLSLMMFPDDTLKYYHVSTKT